jgi:SAM-dependent methyltransferase
MSLNLYNDKAIATPEGFGMDISIQRADDLDNMAITEIQSRTGRVRALDLACGHGGQAIRMAKAGAMTVAVDHSDLSDLWLKFTNEAGLYASSRGSVDFIHSDIIEYLNRTRMKFDVISFQRTLHYFSHADAIHLLKLIRKVIKHERKLYISASGFLSELGEGYAACHAPIDERFDYLSKAMRDKHGIHHPVCLYRPDELKDTLIESGWRVDQVFSSPFKNVKAIAQPSV